MQRIGIYGGAFNPPHIGHIRAAEYAVGAMELDMLLVIPSGASPHKPLPADSARPQQRIEMMELALQGKSKIQVSDIELRRAGPSYTCDTVQQVKALYPEAELLLFMGTDMFLSFDTWRNPEKILECVSLAVFYRGEPEEKQAVEEKKVFFEEQGAKVYLVENPVTEISSTDLRRLLVFDCGKPFLLPEISEYISYYGLYGTGRCYRQLPIEELEKVVTGLLKPGRVKHVLGCRQTAGELALRHGADPTDAQRAALLHDVTKALDGDLQLTLCAEYGIKLDSFSANNPKTLHALTGSLVAKRVFGENPAVVAAIASHTTGKADMNTLEKIIYVADYMEPNRDFPGVEKLRRLAYEDLDGALEMGLMMTLQLLRQQGRDISPESAQALAFLQNQKKTGKKE